MKYRPICQKAYRWILRFGAGTTGVMLSVLDGCDANVQTAVITGVNTFANNIIDAFFLSITPTESTTTTSTSVQAITEAVASMLC